MILRSAPPTNAPATVAAATTPTTATPTPQTLAQKLIARAAGLREARVGEIVTCAVDLAMFHDSSGPRRLQPMLEELGASIWDRSRVVLVMDHYVPESDEDSRRIVRIARDWAREQQLPHVHDSIGICHVVLPQQGHLRPGMFCVGGDSHSPTGGAFGSYMFGIGSTEMLGVMVTGRIWVRVPRTLALQWDGRLADGVTAKDMMLHLIGRLGMNGGRYEAVEFRGEAVRALPMAERMTLSNMSAELGAQTGLIAPDATTRDWLLAHGAPLSEHDLAHWDDWRSDDDAEVELSRFDASSLVPQVAAPHSPANAGPVDAQAGTAIDVAYIGACTGAKLEDLAAAARVLRGHRVADGVRLVVAPASLRDQSEAERLGHMQVLREAGASVLATSCGACAGYGSTIPDGATVLSSTARNFRGRMGSASARVFLASPYTVAASALRGRITDPRECLA
jgi:3-isopropylmalate/(R)-2-methylmalate dehydratase large subunit